MPKPSDAMIKYFHELTEAEFAKIRKEHPTMTFEECAKLYPQPSWCNYPEATYGIMGCWSLVGHLISGEEHCVNCECYRNELKEPSHARTKV